MKIKVSKLKTLIKESMKKKNRRLNVEEVEDKFPDAIQALIDDGLENGASEEETRNEFNDVIFWINGEGLLHCEEELGSAFCDVWDASQGKWFAAGKLFHDENDLKESSRMKTPEQTIRAMMTYRTTSDKGDVDIWDALEALEQLKSKLTTEEYSDIRYAINAAHNGHLGDIEKQDVRRALTRLKKKA